MADHHVTSRNFCCKSTTIIDNDPARLAHFPCCYSMMSPLIILSATLCLLTGALSAQSCSSTASACRVFIVALYCHTCTCAHGDTAPIVILVHIDVHTAGTAQCLSPYLCTRTATVVSVQCAFIECIN